MLTADTKVHDPTRAALLPIGDRCEAALTAVGVSDASQKVWTEGVPNHADVGFPRVILSALVSRSNLVSSMHRHGVALELSARCYSRDMGQVLGIVEEVQERLTDYDNKVSPEGWVNVWHVLLPRVPQNEQNQGQTDIYGQIVRVEYHLITE